MNGIAVVKLTVDSMRASIMHALTQREVDLRAQVDAALESAGKDGSIEKMVADDIERCIRERVRDEVKSAVWRLSWFDEDGKAAIDEAVRGAMKSAINRRPK